MNESQISKILQIILAGRDAYAQILANAAEGIAEASVDELQYDIARLYGTETLLSDEARAEVVNNLVRKYTDGVLHGGSTCVERVLQKSGAGYIATTRERFVPWLDDMGKNTAADILTKITRMETEGYHPKQIAAELEVDFAGTKHNAMTAARTEASKIRNDARFGAMQKQGYKHVKYITAGDHLVRPEHRKRDGKIYRIEDAPYIGEYNCRCLLVPADYDVEVDDAEVTPNDGEYLTAEEAQR